MWRGDFSSLAFAQSCAETETAAQMKSAGKNSLNFMGKINAMPAANIQSPKLTGHVTACRIALKRLFPDSCSTGVLDFESECSTSSSGSSFRNGDGWHGSTWPYFFRPPQWLIDRKSTRL